MMHVPLQWQPGADPGINGDDTTLNKKVIVTGVFIGYNRYM